MTKGYVRTANHADIPLIASDMREADVAEVRASSGHTPEEALETGLNQTFGITKTICLPNDLPVGMFGVVPASQPRVGVVWMLAANNIKSIHRQFLRGSKEHLEVLCEGYDLVFNFTDARNSVHHRWIKWAGFKIINRCENYGVEQRPFLEFVRIVENRHVWTHHSYVRALRGREHGRHQQSKRSCREKSG